MMLRSRAGRAVPLLVLLTLLAACGGGGGDAPSGPTPAVLSVTLSPPAGPIVAGGTAQLTATVNVTGGASPALSAASSNPSVATVSVSGSTVTVQGVAAGTATITVSAVADPSKSASASVTVQPRSVPCTTGSASNVTLGASTALDGALATTDCTLSDGSYADLYRISLTAAGALQIDLRASAFDAYVLVFDANGASVASDDNSGGGTDARIDRTLAAGTYYVAATSARPGAAGAYRLTIAGAGSTVGGCALSRAMPLLLGATATAVPGSLATTDCRLSDGSYADLYQITLSSQRSLQFDLTSSSYDPYLVIYDANGQVVVQDDDSGGGTDARISRTLAAGTYYIAATSVEVGATGAYTLTVGGGGASGPTACTTANATFLNLGPGTTAVDGILSSTDCSFGDGSYADLYRIAIATTRTVTIDMTSTSVDAYLALYDENGASLLQDDDSGGGSNARIVLTLKPGTYYIAATSYDPKITGPYRLTIQ